MRYPILQRIARELCDIPLCGEHPGNPNHDYFPKTISIEMGGVLRCKWEAYRDANGRSIESIPVSSVLKSTESTAIAGQIGGVVQYKPEVYCSIGPFFSQTFRAPPNIAAKILEHPAKKFGLPGC